MSLDVGELVARMRIDNAEFGKGLDKGEARFKETMGELSDLAKVAGIAIAAALGAALLGEMNRQDVGAKVAAQLGEGSAGAARYGKLAGKIYADNFGQSLQEIGSAISLVQRMNIVPEDSSAEHLRHITELALTMSDVFGQDVSRAVSAVSQLIRTGLAKDAEEAFDIITKGIQMGVDKSEDLLDTFNEYSTEFRALGLSGQQALGLMSQSLKAGARDSDTVADALKEFAIRSKDASTLSAEGFKTIGLNAEEMTAIFAAGGPRAAAGLDTVLDRLRAMTDPVKRNAAAVALFGTKAEDLDAALFAMDLTTATDGMKNLTGATQRAADTMANTASANLESLRRQFTNTFVEVVGGRIVPIINEVAGALARDFGPALAQVGGWIKQNKEWLAPLAVTLGTFAGIILTIVAAMKIWTAITAAYTVVQWALNAAMLANPIGLIVVALLALVAGLVYAYHHSEAFRKIVDATWAGIKTAVGAVVDWLKNVAWPYIRTVWEGIAAGAMWLWGIIQTVVGFYVGAFKWWMNVIQSTAALFLWLYAHIIAPVVLAIKMQITALAAIFMWLYDNAIAPMVALWAGAINWIWHTVTEPFIDSVVAKVRFLADVWRTVFSAVSGWVADGFGQAVGIVKSHINMIIGLINRAVDFINRNVIDKANKVPNVSYDHLGHIPQLARGGAVQPRAGGRPVIMGDGGEVEYGIPHSAMTRIIERAVTSGRGGGDGATLTVVIRGDGIMRGIREQVRIEGEDVSVLVGA